MNTPNYWWFPKRLTTSLLRSLGASLRITGTTPMLLMVALVGFHLGFIPMLLALCKHNLLSYSQNTGVLGVLEEPSLFLFFEGSVGRHLLMSFYLFLMFFLIFKLCFVLVSDLLVWYFIMNHLPIKKEESWNFERCFIKKKLWKMNNNDKRLVSELTWNCILILKKKALNMFNLYLWPETKVESSLWGQLTSLKLGNHF